MDKQWTQDQLRAIECDDKNCIVEAGAGSGKTAVIVARYCRLKKKLRKKSDGRILLITFTNKAASELKERIMNELGAGFDDSKDCISTIHGFCELLIRQYAVMADLLPNVRILDDGVEKSELIDQVIEKCVRAWRVSSTESLEILLSFFGQSKLFSMLRLAFSDINKSHHALKQQAQVSDSFRVIYKAFVDLCQHCLVEFEKRLQQDCVYPFDRLLSMARLIIDHPQVRKRLQKDFSYIIIDEFQDTDLLQWEIITLLCDDFRFQESRKLFLVGDARQSIYGFRGASSKIFEHLIEKFDSSESCEVIRLQHNFRTDPSLISYINKSIEKLIENYTPLLAALEANDFADVRVFIEKSDNCREKALISGLWSANEDLNCEWEDMAVLCRTNKEKKHWAALLRSVGVPCQDNAEQSCYQKDCVLDVFMLAKILLDSHDQHAWFRLLSSDWIKLSAGEIEQLFASCKKDGNDLVNYLKKHANRSVQEFMRIFRSAKHILLQKPLSAVLIYCMREMRRLDELSYMEKFFENLINYELKGASFRQLLKEMEQLIEHAHLKNDNTLVSSGVQLLTVHAAKGLEFELVILPDAHMVSKYVGKDVMFTEKGLMINEFVNKGDISQKQLKESDQKTVVHEKKHLLYVALTRAKKRLLILGSDVIKPNSFLCMLKNTTMGTQKCTNVKTFKTMDMDPETANDGFVNFKNIVFNRIHKKDVSRETPITDQQYEKTISLYPSKKKRDHIHSLNWGTWVHRTIELRNKNIKKGIEEILTQITKEFGGRIKEIAQLDLKKYLMRYEKSDVFASVKMAKICYVEHEIVFFDQNQNIVRKRLDLVYFDGKAWHIVDFKTGAKDNVQLREYIQALRIYLQDDQVVIKARFYEF